MSTLKAKVVIGFDGELRIITESGSFEDGKAKLEKLLQALQAQGLNVSLDTPIEQHRHDDQGHHVTAGGQSIHL